MTDFLIWFAQISEKPFVADCKKGSVYPDVLDFRKYFESKKKIVFCKNVTMKSRQLMTHKMQIK